MILGAVALTLIWTWRVVSQAETEGSSRSDSLLDSLAPIWAGSAVVAIAAVSLKPVGSESLTGVNLLPFRSIVDLATSSVDASVALRNVAGNVVLYVPLGVALALWLRKHDKRLALILVSGLSVSLIIELAQLVFSVGRVVDIDDVILNTTGTLIGAGTLLLSVALFRRLSVGQASDP